MNRDINHIDILDNLVEGTGLRNQICLEEKASLLVEASITSSRWPAFMKSELATDRELKLERGQNNYYCGKSLKLSKPSPDCRCQTVLKMELRGGAAILQWLPTVLPVSTGYIRTVETRNNLGGQPSYVGT